MPRMTNTYMLAGESDPQEIIHRLNRVFIVQVWVVAKLILLAVNLYFPPVRPI